MNVRMTPNVERVVLADPSLAYLIERLRRAHLPGYLTLFRTRRNGPFDAIYHHEGERFDASARDLAVAIADALDKAGLSVKADVA